MAEKKEKKNKQQKKQKVKFGLRLKLEIAVTALIVVTVLAMTIFVIVNIRDILTDSIVTSAQREIVILQESAAQAISSGDDLALTSAVNNVKEVKSIKFTQVLNQDGIVLMSLDQKEIGKKILNEHTKGSLNYTNKKDVLTKKYKDPKKDSLLIYDFSLPVYHVVSDERIATVRMGFSNEIIVARVRSVTLFIIALASIIILVAFLATLLLSGVIIRPVKKLSEGVEIIGKGNLDYKIDVISSDEIGMLTGKFNEMTEELKSAKDKEIESRIMAEQLELAREIQEGLNPMDFYNKEGVQINGFTRAAKGVGGDYFDYIDIDENRIGALISDVSGKGVPASLVMVMIRTVFTTYGKRSDLDCASVVMAINDALSADFAVDKFATLFFMIYDRTTGELSFSNAGHGPLFCYRQELKACTVTKIDGVPIGIMEDVEYEQAKVFLNPGDFIVMYSDGITEMRNMDKDEFGRERVQEIMMKYPEFSAKEMSDKIVKEVMEFKGEAPPHDDMTVLVLKREY